MNRVCRAVSSINKLELLPLRFRLFHGRKYPSEDLDDWGSDGPIFPASFVHTTYGHNIRLGGPQSGEAHLELYVSEDDQVYYDGVWYGDWTIYPAGCDTDLPIAVCDQSKADWEDETPSTCEVSFAMNRHEIRVGGEAFGYGDGLSLVQRETVIHYRRSQMFLDRRR